MIISSLFSCKNSNIESIRFEKKLLSKIEKNGKKFIDTKEKQYLDFKELTEFEWDFFKYISGNESVPVLKDEIKCDLNLDFETSDLNINKSRFYFFKNNNFIKEIEISHNVKVHFYFSNYCSEKEYYESAYNVDESYGVPKPIMAIHTNGGVNSPLIYPGYNWARDLPQDIIVKLIEEYREHYNIVHIKRPDQQGFSDTLECIDTPRGVAYMLLKSEKRIFIDSFAQHMAAALNLPSTVCWVTTNPTVFGYDLHDNVFANPHKKEFTTTSKTYSQYELNESIVDFPWGEDEEVFDINKIFKSINKI